jgi:DNA repair exonuclease SbcCD ATPase subunit
MAQHASAIASLKDENNSLRDDMAANERELTTKLANIKNEADKRLNDAQAAAQQQLAALTEQLTTATNALELARTAAAASATEEQKLQQAAAVAAAVDAALAAAKVRTLSYYRLYFSTHSFLVVALAAVTSASFTQQLIRILEALERTLSLCVLTLCV